MQVSPHSILATTQANSTISSFTQDVTKLGATQCSAIDHTNHRQFISQLAHHNLINSTITTNYKLTTLPINKSLDQLDRIKSS